MSAAAVLLYQWHFETDGVYPADEAEFWETAANAIVDAGLVDRRGAFERSFKIVCPECQSPVGRACMNFGSGGGPHNHQARIDAALHPESGDSGPE